jgi:hypothetical protein
MPYSRTPDCYERFFVYLVVSERSCLMVPKAYQACALKMRTHQDSVIRFQLPIKHNHFIFLRG